MTLVPPAQLASPIDDPTPYLVSPDWAVQIKLDGERVLAHVLDGKVTAFNRNCGIRGIPDSLSYSLSGITGGPWVFDGELVDETYHVFDLLATPVRALGPLRNSPWVIRQRMLKRAFEITPVPGVMVVPYHILRPDKERFYTGCLEAQVEGVIFKRAAAPYRPGLGTRWLKVKFIQTIDVLVTEVGTTKKNLTLGLYKDGEIIEVGRVSALTGQGGEARVGDVVEVTVLSVSDNNQLIQPTKPRIRADKTPEQCLWSQLEQCRKQNPTTEDE